LLPIRVLKKYRGMVKICFSQVLYLKFPAAGRAVFGSLANP
jgi:hypothetical protein